jgi:MarR family transcriptional regulator, transcriptional regulator for hemolysin
MMPQSLWRWLSNRCLRAILAYVQATVTTKQVTTDTVTESLASLMRHLLVTTGREFFSEMEKAGVSLTHAKALMLLIDADEPMSVKAISDAIGLSLPGVSRSIDAMVQRGEVSREEDPRDRRCKLVSVTPKGRKLYERLMAIRMAGVRRFVDELDENEKEALAHGLDAVAGRIP